MQIFFHANFQRYFHQFAINNNQKTNSKFSYFGLKNQIKFFAFFFFPFHGKFQNS